MCGLGLFMMDCRFLTTFFNFEISGLADRFLMEIVTNVKRTYESERGNRNVRADIAWRLFRIIAASLGSFFKSAAS